VVHISHTRTRELKSPPAEPHAGGKLAYNGVLLVAPKESFATLLSPPQCHAAFGTLPHTLASVDQSPVCRLMTLAHPRRGRLGLDFGGEQRQLRSSYDEVIGIYSRSSFKNLLLCLLQNTYKTIILQVDVCSLRELSLSWSEWLILQVYENQVLRDLFVWLCWVVLCKTYCMTRHFVICIGLK
jgi:hypothetical protein